MLSELLHEYRDRPEVDHNVVNRQENHVTRGMADERVHAQQGPGRQIERLICCSLEPAGEGVGCESSHVLDCRVGSASRMHAPHGAAITRWECRPQRRVSGD